MNKQGNTYTILYSAVMVVVVAAILAIASVSLRPFQQENIRIDKMMQILSSVNIKSTAQDAVSLYEKYITDSYVVDATGRRAEAEAFGIDIAAEVRRDAAERRLPVFVCTLDNGDVKYILPLYGAGLWGPIWGYISVDADGQKVYGSYFAHQGETPGLGAEIGNAAFQQQFAGKRLFIDGEFKPVAVMKKGQKPLDGADYVDAISGGTITSKGVQSMIQDCLLPYEPFLKSLDK
ncbi:MAG TPA: NADH:ubiquinone reductase (Na(+)-transporting) subunit C [Candidatus Barnesiella excrementipullorum]|uniref:Na(+)-translocating NADH-quinone reductase subunit C n=1 Tax=Candidatus Barnesiella excrementipullorum TaxID=2838479 RepID=A0A9D2AQP5_9BACT|nr:NADH:ubiquinone reductase (Na(+)-transporting) subunit C [Candidatus Barnesiella excrementipullorum]